MVAIFRQKSFFKLIAYEAFPFVIIPYPFTSFRKGYG